MDSLVGSVAIYLSMFSVALLCFYLSETQQVKSIAPAVNVTDNCGRSYYLKGVNAGYIFAVMGILFISLFAAFRDPSVGVDTSVYPAIYMNIASGYGNIFDFLVADTDLGSEPLHAIILWLCSRVTDGTVLLLFCYQFLTIGPVYLAARNLRNKLSVTVSMAVYLFFFFNNSLNMMRQSVSCAMLLLAFSYIMKSKSVSARSIVPIAIAVLFHKSGIYGLILLSASAVVSLSKRRWLKWVMFMLIAMTPLMLSQVGSWLISSGIADSHMAYYFDVFISGGEEKDWFVNPVGIYSLAYLIMYGVLIALPAILSSKLISPVNQLTAKEVDPKLYQILRVLNIMGLLLYIVLLFSLKTMYGIRFAIFFDFFLILSIPLSCEHGYRTYKITFVMMLLVAIWFVWIILLGWSGSQTYRLFFGN